MTRHDRPMRFRSGPARHVTLAVGNTASVSLGTKASTSAFRRLLNAEGVDVWLVTEGADYDAAQEAPDDLQVVQFGAKGSPESGTALLARTEVARLERPYLRLGSEATSEGGGIRARFITGARLRVRPTAARRGWARTVEVGHAPPPRAARARAAFMRRFLKGWGLRGGDVNLRLGRFRRLAKGRAVVGDPHGVLHLAVPRSLKVHDLRFVKHGSDHRAVLVTVAPRWWAR